MSEKKMQAYKIYIPILWPDVFDICEPDSLEYYYAKNILLIPIDQRYGIKDMEYVINILRDNMEESNDK